MTAGSEGSLIDERFELLERLGGGGMGLVWRARDIVLHRDVALKEVRPPDPDLLRLRPDAAEMLRKRVLREAVSLARISHPNVVTIHHIVSSAEVAHPWLVMELISGGSLQDRLERGPCTPTETARLGRGVLAGLRAAHGAGILHRDVKPGNVLMRTDGTPLLTDFGIAAVREATSLTNTGELIGSPDYMAPERLRGRDDDPSSDLWSLAMMLYVAVEGHHPMHRSSTLATLAAILEEDVPPPRRAGTLGPVLRSVLIKDVASRPDAESLDRLLAQAAGARVATVLDGMVVSPVRADPVKTADGAPVPVPYTPTEPAASGPPERGAGSDAAGQVRDEVQARDEADPPAAPEPGPGPTPDGATDGAGHSGAETSRTPARGTGSAGRSRRRLVIPAALLGALVIGLLVSEYAPDFGGGEKPSAGSSSTPSATRTPTPSPSASLTSSPTPSPAPTLKEETDLLTPSGARRVLKKMKAVTGGTKVLPMFRMRADSASGNTLLDEEIAPGKKVFDNFSYEDGRGTLQGAEGILKGHHLLDLDQVDWDTLPRLLRIAQTELGVLKPNPDDSRVTFDWYEGQAAMLVYASGEYQTTGLLIASFDGQIIRRARAD
ncbi:serine/threonine-protein kinase [Streptomyces sp. MW-W600-10]|uniref:serine/threonine-protein kinase n=1 Tax=Streptomyces sp. MW-W600-10 TaxID=2829819 RepID=UPI001C473BEC|nr:serine/threonine-protein kinase [Streptomyces sp. MW-W600-10]MBV7245258.1 protein kinase [Streptomyces sp. MW-W600-10]